MTRCSVAYYARLIAFHSIKPVVRRLARWMRRDQWLIIPLISLLILATLFLAQKPILIAIGSFLIVQDEIQPADMVHVLGGGGFERLDYAALLYRQGYAQQIFATGDRYRASYPTCSSSEYLVCQGVHSQDLEPNQSWATNTYQEALELKHFLESKPGEAVASVLVVSTPYHMRRAKWTFKRVLGSKVSLRFAPVPFGMSRYKPCWWTDKRSREMVMNEYVKLVFYWLRYSWFN
jgi:uncharacterized SAM-binding protein YcdF (DUF218 family)